MRPPKSAPCYTPGTEDSLWLGMRIPMLLAVVLICALFARLIGITQAFVDKNSWRQADVAMIAQNFFDGGYDILHPRIDWSADTTGVVGTEFPLLPLLAALLYNLFGLHDWIGRLIPVIFFCASMPFFFLLVRKLADTETGLLALAFYAFAPLGIVISRSFMPDAVALSLAVIGLYFFLIWVDSMRLAHLGLAAWLVSGAILVKAPYGMVLLPIVYVAYRRFGWKAISIKPLWGFAIVALVPSLLWYVHALSIPTAILASGEKPHFFGEQGVGFVNAKQVLVIVKRNFWPYLTPLVVVPSIPGIFLFGTTSRFGKLFHFWLIAMAMFILFVGTGNADHHWYQLPLVPIASAFAAAAIVYVFRATSKKRVTSAQYSVAALVLLGSLGWLAYYGLRRDYVEWNPGCMQAAAKLDQIALPSARLLIPDEGDPSCMYYSRRKGWHFWTPADDSDAIAFLERYRAQGAGYLILDEYHLWWLDYYKGFATHLKNQYTITARSNRYVVFNLKPLNP